MPPIAISKTRLLHYFQCPKRLWLEQYSPELEDEGAYDEAAIETGRVVGEKAREVYGKGAGHLIDHNRGLRSAIAETTALLEAGGETPIFEATFDYDGLTVQVDVLDRSQSAPRIIEVKSSTSVKDHFLADCAIQAWTLEQLGIAPQSTALALINTEFVYAGDDNYDALFHEVDLTPDLGPLIGAMPEHVAATRETLESLDEPERDIGPHCTTPHPCPFFTHCAPEQGEFPILGLGGRKEPLYGLMLEGYRDVRDLAEDQLANEQQQRVWRQTVAGEPFVSPELRQFVESLEYPRYFLDFETIAFAIPIWPSTRPYQALPFQWSCHIDDGTGSIGHEEHLDLSGEPPMRRIAEELIERLGTAGPIIVYTSYEKRVLNELAERYADLAPALEALAGRLVDLYPVAKQHYYHPEMRGSWSIKAVLPTIGADVDYSILDEVRDGEAAQAAYLEAIHEDTPPERRESLREALLAYCRLDTLALVKLTEFFSRAS
jgi:CRISPR/Cas system-associated exonuclease Cas4 (RecB family)